MKKRGSGEGSIYRRKNGVWCAQLSIQGKRLTKYAKTRRECQIWLREAQARQSTGLIPDAHNLTLDRYLPYWLDLNRSHWAPSTHRQYAQLCRDHILPLIGRIKLTNLRPDHIQQILNADVGQRTRSLIYAVLRRALNQAIKWQLIAHSPLRTLNAPAQPRSEMRALDPAQARHFLEACRDHRLSALFYLAISTGLRQGELLGLMWSDLDRTTGALRIQRQLRRVYGSGLQFTDLKTAASRRQIIIGVETLDRLKAHRIAQLRERLFQADWHDRDLIFTNALGGPIDPSKLYKIFRQILDAAGLPQIRFHDLRHTAASLMLSQGIHPKIVQERLGHSSINITLDTYSHIIPTLQQNAAGQIEAILSAK